MGNGDYVFAPKLATAANDANDVAAALTRLRFEVLRGTDLDLEGMRALFRQFTEKAAGAEASLFFYAGHSLQSDGGNYLLPIDMRLRRTSDPAATAFDLGQALRGMERDPRLSLLFIDAARANPIIAMPGLAAMEARPGTLVVFAAQPGSVAPEGTGRNSPFTAALLRRIETQGLPIADLTIGVRNEVVAATASRQVPWEQSGLTERFYFKPPPGYVPPRVAAADKTPEETFWAGIKMSQDPDVFEDYLDRYPSGVFASAAHAALKRLSDPARAAEVTDAVVLNGASDLAEIQTRLYALNFNPAGQNLATAIRAFETQSQMPQTGRPTRALLERLRETPEPKPWGAIVHASDGSGWGIAWSQETRSDALASAHRRCGANCRAEVSFAGTSCGAFAQVDATWSLAARDASADAKQAALDQCGRAGRACRIIAAVCADGSSKLVEK